MSKQSSPSQSRASTIFINYRRDDSAGYAGRLFDKLSVRYGDRLFMDVDYIAPGLDFVEVIEKAVGSCAVLIVVIGQQWLTITDKTGKRRLDNPDDFVRVEIEAALKRNIRVIPVLVEDASMPHRADLPSTMEKLARRNAIELSDARWSYDVDRLIKTLEEVLAQVEGREPDRPPETTKETVARIAQRGSQPGTGAAGAQSKSSSGLLKIVIGVSAAIFLVALGSILVIVLWKRQSPANREIVVDRNNANSTNSANSGAANTTKNTGNASVSPTATPSVTPSPSPTPQSAGADLACSKYSPKSLIIEEATDGIWQLKEARATLIPRLDNKTDAEKALAVAQQHTARCFLGNRNRRPEPRDYTMSYWTGGSIAAGSLKDEDCLPFSPQALRIEDQGKGGWLLTDGRSRMVMLDNQADAEQALAVAKQYSYHCFIGRNNSRKGRKYYIVEYWK